jgi:hypothetical protein
MRPKKARKGETMKKAILISLYIILFGCSSKSDPSLYVPSKITSIAYHHAGKKTEMDEKTIKLVVAAIRRATYLDKSEPSTYCHYLLVGNLDGSSIEYVVANFKPVRLYYNRRCYEVPGLFEILEPIRVGEFFWKKYYNKEEEDASTDDVGGLRRAAAAQGTVDADSPAKSAGNEENHEVQEGNEKK